MLKDLLSEEKVLFDEAVAQDTSYIEQASKMIEASRLSDCVDKLEELIA